MESREAAMTDKTTCVCGCLIERHDIEPPYPCYDCSCVAFFFTPAQTADSGEDCDFEPYDPEIFDECGGVRLDLIKSDPGVESKTRGVFDERLETMSKDEYLAWARKDTERRVAEMSKISQPKRGLRHDSIPHGILREEARRRASDEWLAIPKEEKPNPVYFGFDAGAAFQVEQHIKHVEKVEVKMDERNGISDDSSFAKDQRIEAVDKYRDEVLGALMDFALDKEKPIRLKDVDRIQRSVAEEMKRK